MGVLWQTSTQNGLLPGCQEAQDGCYYYYCSAATTWLSCLLPYIGLRLCAHGVNVVKLGVIKEFPRPPVDSLFEGSSNVASTFKCGHRTPRKRASVGNFERQADESRTPGDTPASTVLHRQPCRVLRREKRGKRLAPARGNFVESGGEKKLWTNMKKYEKKKKDDAL